MLFCDPRRNVSDIEDRDIHNFRKIADKNFKLTETEVINT